MAQVQAEEKMIPEDPEKGGSGGAAAAQESAQSGFKFNAQAPEFVPRSHTQVPISGYFYPCFQILGGSSDSDWFYVGDHDPAACLIPAAATSAIAAAPIPNCSNKNVLTPDLQQKIIKQVEYQFSDMSLLANESFQKQVNKDPEGYVPISLIASTKKIKSLTNNTHLITQALRSSSKVVLSPDGKKVKRKNPFTEKDKEELQSRTVVAENLPDDHSHQNIQKIFSVVGSVKTIRICHPPESNSSRPKGDFFISNKLHALVEYETPDVAEKAVEKLNDERNWRKGMRVRVLFRCSSRKSDFDGYLDDDDMLNSDSAEDSSHSNNTELTADTNVDENSVGSKKGWARGRGKGRGRTQIHAGRGLLAPPSQPSSVVLCEASTKSNTKGPRMPDGTRGFTMGRGKPINSPALASSPQE
ncbi:la-related protein 6C isoform X2 [Arachis ipaensis]|uniref:la-related protein 6C isoform X2 n=1 Tax=Arachis ipaensis TaxID=130454 RepID=UPI000A2AFD74|nr:la-related protein 6C isoform X2 [Arachis ipaensis]